MCSCSDKSIITDLQELTWRCKIADRESTDTYVLRAPRKATETCSVPAYVDSQSPYVESQSPYVDSQSPYVESQSTAKQFTFQIKIAKTLDNLTGFAV